MIGEALVRNYLTSCKDVYQNLISLSTTGNNVVIGGSLSLLMHGIITHKAPLDIDIIVYKPSEEQMRIIEAYGKSSSNRKCYCEYNRRSYKIVREGFYDIDILVEDKEMPTGLLIFNHNYCTYNVQSIENLMEARRSYISSYIRKKDYISTIKLKELNFNLHTKND